MVIKFLKTLFGNKNLSRITFDRRNDEKSSHEEGIYTVNSDGSNCRQILSSGHSSFPTWSPDGNWIAFTNGEDSSLFVMDENGKNIRRLTFHKGEGASVAKPSWSPDSKELVYAFHEYVEEKHKEQIFVVTLDTKIVKQLTHVGNNSECIWTFSNEIVIRNCPDEDREGYGHFFVISPDGQNQRELGLFKPKDRDIVWTYDGNKVIFRNEDGFFIMNADGSGKKLIPTKGRVCSMIISPDGQSIAYSSEVKDYFEVFVSSLDGTSEKKIVANSNDFHSRDISWSPLV